MLDTLKHKVKEAGKPTMVLVVNQAKDVFKKDMSENEFLNLIFGRIPVASRTKEGTEFFKKAFFYLEKGMTDDEIYKNEDGETTLALAEKAKKSKSVSDAFIIDGSKPDWGEIIRFAIELLRVIYGFIK